MRAIGIATISALLAAWTWAAEGPVIGKLGQALEPVAIHAGASSRSSVLSRAKAYQYLVIRSTSQSAWVGVVLNNRRVGYARRTAVAELPYEVRAAGVREAARSLPGGTRSALAGYALNFTGTPYKWGGNDLRNGIDCSGFVQQLYGQIGLQLPRTAAQQALVGQPIARLEDLRPGDRLYFWDQKRGLIGHTGIYLGGVHFVHSSSNRGGVGTDDLRNPRWRNTLVAARR